MVPANDLRDEGFLTAFETGSLPRDQWTHAAHVRMAWLYLTRFPFPTALERIRTGIQNYNTALGNKTGYHETITQVFTHLIHLRIGKRPESFADFCARHPEMLDRSLAPLLEYYRRETLFSDAARAAFVEPDMQPLPNHRDTKGSEGPRT